jgi:copper oxidase (laccase) domain-containing protein
VVLKKIDGLRVLQSEALLRAGVPHGWFDASLGDTMFRPGNPYNDPTFSDEQTVHKRWSKACTALGLDVKKLVITSGLLQTDIIRVVELDQAGQTVGPADGYITKTSKLPILLRAGDCIQVVLFAPGVLGVVHVGGVGAARGTLAKAVRMMREQYGVDPAKIVAALGPSLAPEHFVPSREADGFTLDDIAEAHPVTKKLPDGRIGYDIATTAVRQLLQEGLIRAHIELSGIDTFSDERWFSWERNHISDKAAAMRRHGLFVALP